MSDAVTFRRHDAERIIRAVKQVERNGAGSAGDYRGKPPSGFTGIVYLAGKKFDLTASARKKWVKVDVAAGTVAYTDTDPTDPFPPGTEYFETNHTHGNIHVTRFG